MKSTLSIALLAAVSGASKPEPGHKALRGVNIGGWMVLEPWITPSLFYQFLGKTQYEVGMDTSTFCKALGADKANEVLRAHWDAWVTEDHIRQLAEREVEALRLPIGDWILRQYGPYFQCTNGALEKVQWLLDTADKYGLKVLLDVHGVKGSQNGYDNSGMANQVTWVDENHFEHSPVVGEWMGKWNGTKYESIDQQAIDWAVKTVDMLVDRWGNHPAVFAIEPVNEPWIKSDFPTLRDFYRRVRENMKQKAPHLLFVFHDSFKFSGAIWNRLFDDDDMENVVMDTHLYMFFWPKLFTVHEYSEVYSLILSQASRIKYPVWVGEWSLATDHCAMWLQGFNDSSGTEHFDCEWVECPDSYLPEKLAPDFDRTAEKLGPFGLGTDSTPMKGMCPRDSAHFGDRKVAKLGADYMKTFDKHVHGQFFWTFRNELEPRWNYITAYDNGWLPSNQTEDKTQSIFL